MPDLYVDLAIPGAVDKIFTYAVPRDLEHAIRRGVRVVTSFGTRTVIGFIVDSSRTSQECAERGRTVPHIKPIQDVLDREPVISDELLTLTRWMAEYYFAPWGEVLKSVLIQGAARPGRRTARLTVANLGSALRELAHAPRQAAILRALAERNGGGGGESTAVGVQQLRTELRLPSIHAALNELAARGMIELREILPRSRHAAKVEQVIDITEEARARWQAWLAEPGTSRSKRLERQAAMLRLLAEAEIPAPPSGPAATAGAKISVTEFLKQTGGSLSTLRTLQAKNLVSLSAREVIRRQEFDLYESSLGARQVTLNPFQRAALDQLSGAINQNAFRTFLLHGVTGSGKTQVYIEAIREARSRQKTAIVLVPEISLTPQIVRRFRLHFGDQVAVFHSRMSAGERYDAWRMAWEGACSIVIGPRSAIFAPLKNVGLIVVDEEHEPSYKQFDQTPRYHARDVAIMRACFSNALVVLGSATPSLESYANALSGKYTLLEMPSRVDSARLPAITLVDMTAEKKRKVEEFWKELRLEIGNAPVDPRREKRKMAASSLSDLLREKIADRLAKKEGIILLQNRRGFSPFVECPDCGHVEMCTNCNISLTYHLTQKHLRCHYCGQVRQPPAACPECRSADTSYRGFGTQRVEQELRALYPGVSLLRMDLDTTTGRGSHDSILRRFSEGEADILLGTQMVAKGLDFARVTLVGVISADTQMLLPDFRSAERTFQLLTQVAGRAGRSTLSGEVIIQTFQLKHPCLQHVVRHDFPAFYAEEADFRKELEYPPFSRIILVEFKGKQENEVIAHAAHFADRLEKGNAAFRVLGPAGAALTRLKELYRWHIVIKSIKAADPGGAILHRALTSAIHQYRASSPGKSRSVSMSVDVDPAGMM